MTTGRRQSRRSRHRTQSAGRGTLLKFRGFRSGPLYRQQNQMTHYVYVYVYVRVRFCARVCLGAQEPPQMSGGLCCK